MQQVGLRELKKRRTRETIARKALELFERQGYQGTTIPQIAEAAEVSARTVSGYFPRKEELVFPDHEEGLARVTARVRERPPGETAPEALRAWLESELPSWQEREHELSVRRRIAESDESLRLYQRRFLVRVQELMAEEIARDLDSSPDELEPRIAAAATSAILEVLEQRPDGAPTPTPAEALRLMDRAALFTSAGIRALRGR
jgi:AcrR family transcriptional regulator